MMQFTTRDLMGLLAVAGVSSAVSLVIAPTEPAVRLIVGATLCVVGCGGYIAGLAIGRSQRP